MAKIFGGANEMAISDEYNEYLKSDKWRKKRSERLKIDNYTCQKCGSGRNLNVHHLNYKHLGNENVYDDLITLCETCHKEIEKRKKNEIPAAIGALQQTDNVQQEVSSSFPPTISGGWIYSGIYYSQMPIDEFLINRSSRVVDGEAYHVYYKHNCHTDTLVQSMEDINYTTYFEYDIVPKQSHIAHIVCKAVVTNKGTFAFYPKSVQYIYKDGTTKNFLCDGCELLYDDGAVLEIFIILPVRTQVARGIHFMALKHYIKKKKRL